MLSRRDALFLRKFLTAAYSRSGDPAPGTHAKEIVHDLAAYQTRVQAVTEVARRCDVVQYQRGTMGLKAEVAREILAHFLSHTCDDEMLWRETLPPSFWEDYARRFAAAEAAAHREADALRLLDVCPPALLFTFYDPPARRDRSG
jgi:hypothetical protein